MGRPPIQLPRITLRFPEDLRDRIEAAAHKNGRSVNQEVVARLEQSFEITDITDTAQWKAVIETFVQQTVDKRLKDVVASINDRAVAEVKRSLSSD